MKNRILTFACIMAATASAASRTATEAYVTNRVTQATNALHEAIAPTIDYSTNNTTLVETIEAKAPAPADYDTVHEKAMSAVTTNDSGVVTSYVDFENGMRAYQIQIGTYLLYDTSSGLEITGLGAQYNFMPGLYSSVLRRQDIQVIPSAAGNFASLNRDGDLQDSGVSYPSISGTIARAATASTNYTDAATRNFLPLTGGTMTGDLGITSEINFFYGGLDGPRIYPFAPGALAFGSRYSEYSGRYAILDLERLPENAVAEIAYLHEVATPETVTNIVRDISLGGIWDEQLGVWWTPVMSNGKLTYQATTNVNMSAETNP